MKKNCFNCKNLSYEHCDNNEADSGYACWKRINVMSDEDERKLLNNLSKDSYLEKAKRCCDLKLI